MRYIQSPEVDSTAALAELIALSEYVLLSSVKYSKVT